MNFVDDAEIWQSFVIIFRINIAAFALETRKTSAITDQHKH